MIDEHVQHPPAASTLRRRAVPFLLTGLLTLLLAAPTSASGVIAGPIAPVAPTSVVAPAPSTTVSPATTASTMAADILGWLNRDRAAAGLRPLRAWTSMATLAGQRSANMAAANTATHQAAGGDPGTALTRAGLGWFSWGEIVGWTSWPWGGKAAADLYRMWKGSPYHHDIMFSRRYNYIGVGIGRASNGATYSSILFTESADHTRPSAHNSSLSYSGSTVRFKWSGSDPLLQTHTAGLRSFDIEYRVDGGWWHLLRNNTTATSLSLSGRAHRHYYSFRVQSADRRGNLSAWTAVKRIWLP